MPRVTAANGNLTLTGAIHMIRDVQFWEKWKAQQIASEPADFQRNLALMDAMYKHARRLGVFESADLTERLKHKTRLARALNGLRSSNR